MSFQLVDFLRQNPDLGTATRAFTQSIEKTQVNINWVIANHEKIVAWLQDVNTRLSWK